MRPQLLLSLLVLLPYTTASPFQFALTLLKHEITPTADNDTCDCTGVNPLNRTSGYICGDYRLGPNTLPSVLPALSLVTNYDRFGGKTPGEYLRLWTNASTGRYVYPPFDGFQLDSDAKPIKGKMMLGVGQEVDRFGSEKGMYAMCIFIDDSQTQEVNELVWQSFQTKSKPTHECLYRNVLLSSRRSILPTRLTPFKSQPGKQRFLPKRLPRLPSHQTVGSHGRTHQVLVRTTGSGHTVFHPDT